MNEDDIIIITQDAEPVVLVADLPETVLVVQEENTSVLVVYEGQQGPKGDPGEVPEWVSKTSITVSNTAPQSPNIGDLWVDTN